MASMGPTHPILIIAIIMSTLTVTVSTLDKLSIEVEVTRNGTSIPWDKDFGDKRKSEFKELALVVKNQLKEDLRQLQGISEIKVKKFKELQGNTLCEFECKANSKVVGKEDIQKAFNGTVDIAANVEVSYTKVDMSLKLSSVSWIDDYSDHNSTEYKNLTSRINAALSEVYRDADDVIGFEIVLLSRAQDGSVMVDYLVLVNPDSDLKKKDLDETLNEFTKNNSFGGMTTGSNFEQEQESKESQSDGPVVGLVVLGALVMCVVIIAFLVRVLWQNWKRNKVTSEDRFEFYAEFYAQKAQQTETDSVTAPGTNSTTPSYSSANSIIVDVHDSVL